jgi:16S rRNA (cytidine1402-2'-O)-methyltransferase
MLAVGIGFSIVVSVVAAMFGFAIFAATAADMWPIAAFIGFVLFLAMLLPAAIYGAFSSAVWTIFFRRLTGRETIDAALTPGTPAPPIGSGMPAPPAPPTAPSPPAPPPPPAPPAAGPELPHLRRRPLLRRRPSALTSTRPVRRSPPSVPTSPGAGSRVVTAGRLSVCATPIGNLGDVTLRVLETLRTADVVLAEDTRVTRKLFARHGISSPLEPYHAHNLEKRTPAVIERIAAGSHVALVSDAGTPGISDPGAHIVDACIAAGIPVEVLPGPSAIIAALVASGLPTHAFYFGGFLPRKKGDRSRRLAALGELDATLVFYESPKRTAATAAALAEALPGRDGCMVRELTKLYEEIVRAPLDELAAMLAERGAIKGEVVLLVGPRPRGARDEVDEQAVYARIEQLMETGVSRTEAVKRTADEIGVGRNEVYRIAHREPGETGSGTSSSGATSA